MIGNLGWSELLVILTIALLVFGPHRLPEIARTIGRSLAYLRRSSAELRGTVERELQANDLTDAVRELRDAARVRNIVGNSLSEAIGGPPSPSRAAAPPASTPPATPPASAPPATPPADPDTSPAPPAQALQSDRDPPRE